MKTGDDGVGDSNDKLITNTCGLFRIFLRHHPAPSPLSSPGPFLSSPPGTDRVAQGATVNRSQTVVMFYPLACTHHSNKESATRMLGFPGNTNAGDDGINN